jgi:hypothetical protein
MCSRVIGMGLRKQALPSNDIVLPSPAMRKNEAEAECAIHDLEIIELSS